MPRLEQAKLDNVLRELGFTPVKFWRESLRPLTVVELQADEYSEVADLRNSFDDSVALPKARHTGAMDLLNQHTNRGGVSVGGGLVADLLAKSGVQVQLDAAFKASTEFVFQFQDPSIEMVDVDLLVRAVAGVRLNREVAERWQRHRIQRHVVIRSVRAKTLTLQARDQKGALVDLRGSVQLPNAKGQGRGSLSGQWAANGELVLKAPKPLVFGIDLYQLDRSEKNTVTIGVRNDPQRRSGLFGSRRRAAKK